MGSLRMEDGHELRSSAARQKGTKTSITALTKLTPTPATGSTLTEVTNLQPLPNTLDHMGPGVPPAPSASPSDLLASDWDPSKDEYRGLAWVLSTLMMRTNFWGPPEDCWRRENG